MKGKRKEINLDEQTVAVLEAQAHQEGRKLKNYMEFVLLQKAKELALSPEYKEMMDNMLNRHAKKEVTYSSWQDVKKSLKN